MASFPKESVDLARGIAGKYLDRNRAKVEIAWELFNKRFYEIKYGFDEALRDGNCGKHLHEISKNADCFTMAGSAIYLIAREAGLEPKLYHVSGMRDVEEGDHIGDVSPAGHSFVTVKTRKNEEFAVDPFGGLFGKIGFDHGKNKARIYCKGDDRVVERHYSSLVQLSEDRFLEMLEKNRSGEGGRNILSGTQRVKAAGGYGVFVSYLPEEREIKSSFRADGLKTSEPCYDFCSVLDLTTRVGDDGAFDFNDGRLAIYHARKSGWVSHVDSQVPVVFEMRDVGKLWNIWDGIAKGAGRKSSVFGMNSFRLRNILLDNGFSDRFDVKSGSLAEEVISKKRGSLDEFLEGQERAVWDFVSRSKGDGLSHKMLLRNSRYVKAMDEAGGFVFSDAEHLDYVQESYEGYLGVLDGLAEGMAKRAFSYVKLDGSTNYFANRKFNSGMTGLKKRAASFDDLCAARKYGVSKVFSGYADRCLFMRDFDIGRMNVGELSEGLNDADLFRGAQKWAFGKLVLGRARKNSLFLGAYGKGLQGILNKG